MVPDEFPEIRSARAALAAASRSTWFSVQNHEHWLGNRSAPRRSGGSASGRSPASGACKEDVLDTAALARVGPRDHRHAKPAGEADRCCSGAGLGCRGFQNVPKQG